MPAPKLARPVRPNAGLEAEYRRKLDRHIARMHRSLVYWLTAAYRANTPELVLDESPARALQQAMRALKRRWLKEFGKLAEQYGPQFAHSTAASTDRSYAQALRDAGLTVRFRMTAPINDVVQAAVAQNVTLIKSIAEQHLTQVEGLVMRSVQAGRDLGSLTEALEHQYGVTRRRAAFIALDQNNKTTAAVTRARQVDQGITEAVWMHSHGGKTPRPTHVAMNGKRYDVTKGMWDPAVRRWIYPGEEPHCRCISRSVIPGFN